MSDLLPHLSSAERRALSGRLSAAAHLRAALSRDGGRRACERPHDRHGAAAAGLGARLRGAAADLSDRLQRRDHARRAAAGRPLQHRAARRRTLPHPRRGSRAEAYRRAIVEPCRTERGRRRPRGAPAAAVEARNAAGAGHRAVSLGAAALESAGPADATPDPVGDGRRGSGERAGAVPRSRTARKAGAARAAMPAQRAPNRSSSCSR